MAFGDADNMSNYRFDPVLERLALSLNLENLKLQ